MNHIYRLASIFQSNHKTRNFIQAVRSKRRAILINLSLFVFSTIFALVLSEVALRLMDLGPMYVSPERERFWKYDSLLGWSHQPEQEGIFETPQFRTRVHINKDGLRDRERSYERQTNTPRILVLGDSFAWGYGVEESERFSQRLEETLGVEVINAGVSGYSTDQELIWYREKGIKYETDLVILVVSGNDVGDNERLVVNQIYYKPKFVIEEGKLVAIGYPIPQISPQGKLIYSLSQRSALGFFLVQRYFDILSLYNDLKDDSTHANPPQSGTNAQREPFKLTMALIQEIRNIARSRNAELLIVSTDRWWNLGSGETYKDFVTGMQCDGLLVLDVESMPGFDPETMLIPDDGHWNQAGHQFVTQKIKEAIATHELLDPPGPQEETNTCEPQPD